MMSKNVENLLNSTMDVAIFDTDNNLVAELNKTQEVEVDLSPSSCYITVRNGLYNIDLLKFMGKHKQKDDMSSYLNSKDTLLFGGKHEVRCKVVTKTLLYDPKTNKVDREMIMEFPNAAFTNELIIKGENLATSPFDVRIKVSEIDECGNFFFMHV